MLQINMSIVERTFFHNRKIREKIIPQDTGIVLYRGWSAGEDGKEQIDWKEIKDIGNGYTEFRWLHQGKGRSVVFIGEEVNQYIGTIVTGNNRLGVTKRYKFETCEKTDHSPLP